MVDITLIHRIYSQNVPLFLVDDVPRALGEDHRDPRRARHTDGARVDDLRFLPRDVRDLGGGPEGRWAAHLTGRRGDGEHPASPEGDEEAQMYDYDYVEALEYGMPPTCGFGMSERVFSFLMDKSMRECQIFPLMKPKSRNL